MVAPLHINDSLSDPSKLCKSLGSFDARLYNLSKPTENRDCWTNARGLQYCQFQNIEFCNLVLNETRTLSQYIIFKTIF